MTLSSGLSRGRAARPNTDRFQLLLRGAVSKKKKQQQTGDFERLNFKSLILTNPNYFGTFKGAGFKLIKAMSTNTSYEELMCLGFHPQLSQLEGVVYVKKNSGYSGDLCSGGSTEYVRFYLSFDGGATWDDQGMAQFSAFDMPGSKPLEYGVSMPVNPRRRFCWTENLIKARAILSWNEAPTANDPGYTPFGGTWSRSTFRSRRASSSSSTN